MSSSSGKVVVGEEEEEEDQPVKVVPKPVQQPNVLSTGKVVVGEEEEEEAQPVVSKTLPEKASQSKTFEVKQIVESSTSISQKIKEETSKLNEETEKKIKGEAEGMKYFAKFDSDKSYYTSDTSITVSTLDTLKVKPKTLLEKKIVEQNEQIRKIWAIKLLQMYQQLNTDLTQISTDLNNSVNMTQDISHRQLEANDDLITLSTKLPHASSWLNSFISGLDIDSLAENESTFVPLTPRSAVAAIVTAKQ